MRATPTASLSATTVTFAEPNAANFNVTSASIANAHTTARGGAYYINGTVTVGVGDNVFFIYRLYKYDRRVIDMEKNNWHLSKSVPVTLIVALVLQAAAIVWTVSQMQSSIEANANKPHQIRNTNREARDGSTKPSCSSSTNR